MIDSNNIVLPGDVVNDYVDAHGKCNKVKLGPGLHLEKHDVVACKAGKLHYKAPNVFWIDSHQKRYVPSKGDYVVGVTVGRQGDFYKVDIGSSDLALLNFLSFEGASKRNKPNISNGDVIFGRLVVANKEMEPEISCVESSGKANGLGVLPKDGLLFHVSLNLSRKLLSPECILLPELGSRFCFEIVIGMNGRIVLFSKTINQILMLVKLVVSSEYLTNSEILKSITFVK